MQKIGHLVRNKLRISKINLKVANYQVLRIWEPVLISLFPETAGTTMAVSMDKGVLRIASLSKSAAEKILIFQKRIIHHLNEKVGAPIVFKIICEH